MHPDSDLIIVLTTRRHCEVLRRHFPGTGAEILTNCSVMWVLLELGSLLVGQHAELSDTHFTLIVSGRWLQVLSVIRSEVIFVRFRALLNKLILAPAELLFGTDYVAGEGSIFPWRAVVLMLSLCVADLQLGVDVLGPLDA